MDAKLDEKMDLTQAEHRTQIRELLMRMGGLSLAAQRSTISYNRLSRILRGWVQARPEDIAKLSAYLKGQL